MCVPTHTKKMVTLALAAHSGTEFSQWNWVPEKTLLGGNIQVQAMSKMNWQNMHSMVCETYLNKAVTPAPWKSESAQMSEKAIVKICNKPSVQRTQCSSLSSSPRAVPLGLSLLSFPFAPRALLFPPTCFLNPCSPAHSSTPVTF